MPRVPVGEVRIGGFGGADGLAVWLREHAVDAVIDATHPFAANITANAFAATREIGGRCWCCGGRVGPRRLTTIGVGSRPRPLLLQLLPELGKRAFLTIGRQGLDAFAGTGLWTLARCVDPPEPRPTWCTLILARGPFALVDEETILRDHGIDVLVTKDSGGPATAAKLTAARRLGIPVILIRRPPLPAGVAVVETVAEVVQWVMRASHSPST